MFTDINGNPVELFSQVDVADDPGGGTQFPYISTSWEPGGTIIEFDCNNNGVLDSIDISNGTSDDCDLNGIPDECEPDCNMNGTTDACDIIEGTSQDCNENEVPDTCDINDGTSQDADQNSVPDECEAQVQETCDVDANGDIDRTDVRSILMNRNQPASGPDDPMDADGDGQITIRDAKICISQCTNPRCAPSNG
jgi:hypothetical protein